MTDFSFKDRVFHKPLSSVKAFEFDDAVTQVFDDMIYRSVPGYDVLLRLIALYAEIFITPESNVYDLGCSTGVVSKLLSQQASSSNSMVHAVDNSPSMIRKCEQTYIGENILWHCADIQSISINQASMVVLNLTLQFIKPQDRAQMLQKVFDALNPGGILVLTEKIKFDDEVLQDTFTELYHAFKKVQGYSDLEISQKRTALENVLIPDSKQQHHNRLMEVGFDEVYECFHCLNFVSFLAIKA